MPDCKHFTGYKPCFPNTNCLEECVDPQPRGTRILIINLEAMGNVLVTTSLLPAIKRKYKQSTVYWITLKNAYRLLDNNPYIDKAFVWEPESWLKLQAMEFDVVMNIDKSVQAGAFIMSLNATKKLGYGLNKNGIIIPLNKEAEYNYRLGLDDELKFRINQKPNTQLLTEAMGLKWKRDEYVLNLTEEEMAYCSFYKQKILRDDIESRIANFELKNKSAIRNPQSEIKVVGLNSGCSLLYPNKKMTIDQHVILINELSKQENLKLVLLGGPEDTERNAEIVRRVDDKVVDTPTTEGLRRGICYENICDVVISGDSFGMHVAIGLKKHVIAWFGVSCPQEIDLYERGVKLIPESLHCSPCWKHQCPYNLECVQMIDLEKIVMEVDTYVRLTSSLKHN
ncbi:MAG: glycosyltransferase family 9 protein [Ignavibacteriae bacterium]|nr:glycosyltransferase family 9 protein [Ignavibacteriota bacterium]